MKINTYRWRETNKDVRQKLLARAQLNIQELIPIVEPIVNAVREDGDAALRRYTQKFDGADIGGLPIAVSESEFSAAQSALSSEVREAIEYAVQNTRTFHMAQVESDPEPIEVRPGIIARERVTPLDSVGLYVPSGRGSFPSMMYMLAVPGALAGVPDLAVATPPRIDGTVDPAVLYAAQLCGLERVYRIGGSQAIAAFAFGTESVTPVRKIIGPGSAYVAAAKHLVSEAVDVGLPAGPSESIVLADKTADPHLVALDLMIEAEHGSDSAALLVTDSAELATRVKEEIAERTGSVPEPRRTFLIDVFAGYGGVILTDSWLEAVEIVNEFAPEHLLIHGTNARDHADAIRNAGEILIGPYTAFSLANYATGVNAVLPTGGWAKTYSAVGVRDFQKRVSVVDMTANGYDDIHRHVTVLADYEGFYTHAAALRDRSKD